jgi:hypothetical protein
MTDGTIIALALILWSMMLRVRFTMRGRGRRGSPDDKSVVVRAVLEKRETIKLRRSRDKRGTEGTRATHSTLKGDILYHSTNRRSTLARGTFGCALGPEARNFWNLKGIKMKRVCKVAKNPIRKKKKKRFAPQIPYDTEFVLALLSTYNCIAVLFPGHTRIWDVNFEGIAALLGLEPGRHRYR